MTLDNACDAFEDRPTRENAAILLEAAIEYWRDEMIDVTTMVAIVERVANKLREPE